MKIEKVAIVEGAEAAGSTSSKRLLTGGSPIHALCQQKYHDFSLNNYLCFWAVSRKYSTHSSRMNPTPSPLPHVKMIDDWEVTINEDGETFNTDKNHNSSDNSILQKCTTLVKDQVIRRPQVNPKTLISRDTRYGSTRAPKDGKAKDTKMTHNLMGLRERREIHYRVEHTMFLISKCNPTRRECRRQACPNAVSNVEMTSSPCVYITFGRQSGHLDSTEIETLQHSLNLCGVL